MCVLEFELAGGQTAEMQIRQADPIEDRATPRPPIELMLQTLPAEHRAIIVATYFRRRTIDEAARLLGIPSEAAKARLYQGMRDLSDMVATHRSRI
jgi:DNA-directed RNA polymerase specialized sigma24 family protein